MRCTAWHFCSLHDFTRHGLDHFLDSCIHESKHRLWVRPKTGKVVGIFFFEPSTRTRMSFEAAASAMSAGLTRLGSVSSSSIVKGESELDTIRNVAQYCTAIVVRHSQNDFASKLIAAVGDETAVIDGGCGTSSHPTQALLDLATVKLARGDLAKLTWVICGDTLRSRTLRSLLQGLNIYSGVTVRIVSPDGLRIHSDEITWLAPGLTIEAYGSLKEACVGAHVVYMLRMQAERGGGNPYSSDFIMNSEALEILPQDALLLHPGPHGSEMSEAAIVDQRNKMLLQSRMGFYVRKRILDVILDQDEREWLRWRR